MEQVTIIGIDLAKHSFQLRGAQTNGSVAFRKKLSRGKLLDFLASQPRCAVAIEACASAHYWGRETEKLGHEVKLIPPVYVKPFVKRHKNDATDAEAICKAAQRPTMSVNGGGIMLHARRPDDPVAAAQKCATDSPLSVVTRGGGCTAWSSMQRYGLRLSMRG